MYIEIVTLGWVASLSSVRFSWMTARSSGLSVFTSGSPARSATMAMAVCQSSMIATLPR